MLEVGFGACRRWVLEHVEGGFWSMSALARAHDVPTLVASDGMAFSIIQV